MSNGNVVYLADLGPAGVVKDSDSTFWCDSSQCSSGIDLKRVSAAALATYFSGKFTASQIIALPPLQLAGGQLSLLYDPATLAVVSGRLTVIGGGPGPSPGGGGAVDTGGGGAVDTGGGGAVDTGGGAAAAMMSRIAELEARLAALEDK